MIFPPYLSLKILRLFPLISFFSYNFNPTTTNVSTPLFGLDTRGSDRVRNIHVHH